MMKLYINISDLKFIIILIPSFLDGNKEAVPLSVRNTHSMIKSIFKTSEVSVWA